MQALHPPEQYDAVVIGSGLAGLTAGLHLQRQGLRTLIVERRGVPGGLCGTFTCDGYEFVIGCNDFGQGLAGDLRQLGVDIQFLTPKSRFHFGSQVISLPPDLPTVLRLVRRLPGIISAVATARRNPQQSIGQLIARHLREPLLADMACLLTYGIMRSPDDVTAADIQEVFAKELGYGYDKSNTPVGGPGRMIDAMVRRFAALGGELRLNCECLGVESEGAEKRVRTSGGILRTRAVLSSQGRWDDFPTNKKPGIELAFLLFALRKEFPYPRRVHTIGWFQPGLAEELRRLDGGLPSLAPSFHIFRSDLPEQRDHYTINALIPLPRGERDPLPERKKALGEHVLRVINESLAGFSQALIYQRFLSPAEYEERFELRAAPSPYVLPPGFRKLPSYDPERDIYFLGTSVQPPGEHAGAAALSGKLAAQQVARRLDPSRSQFDHARALNGESIDGDGPRRRYPY